MIQVKRTKAPQVLVKANGAAASERAKALAHYAVPANRSKAFKFKVYKNSEVKESLNVLFHFKCAYCESKYAATAPVDIEHYRPKGAVERSDGTLIKPGYYWLASDWDNLLPSCIDCNRARNHKHASNDDPELSGKANLFPIVNDERSDLAPGAEGKETRLLIHPCRDKVELYFSYKMDVAGVLSEPARKNGMIRRKAEQSIDIFGLNRIGLVNERGDKYLRIKSQVSAVATCLKLLVQDSENEENQRALAQAICELRALEGDDARYAGMSRFLIKKVLKGTNSKISTIMGNSLDGFSGENDIERLIDKFPCPERRFDGDDGDLLEILG